MRLSLLTLLALLYPESATNAQTCPAPGFHVAQGVDGVHVTRGSLTWVLTDETVSSSHPLYVGPGQLRVEAATVAGVTDPILLCGQCGVLSSYQLEEPGALPGWAGGGHGNELQVSAQVLVDGQPWSNAPVQGVVVEFRSTSILFARDAASTPLPIAHHTLVHRFVDDVLTIGYETAFVRRVEMRRHYEMLFHGMAPGQWDHVDLTFDDGSESAVSLTPCSLEGQDDAGVVSSALDGPAYRLEARGLPTGISLVRYRSGCSIKLYHRLPAHERIYDPGDMLAGSYEVELSAKQKAPLRAL